ncbi:MAG: beta-lactamase domain-containing protein [Parcubacteria group bacterium Gr01-1014_8]|nr:MAG: beta-lactamase domain-containing protein [Parcubacteria group bacterium Gr01-1014_8]
MILTYHEGGCIRASAGDTTLVFGPVSKQSKNFKPTSFGADVAFISVNHPDMNGAEEAGRGEKQPFIIAGPGEYEVNGIIAAGFSSRSKYDLSGQGGRDRINTIYAVDFDGLSVLYLGAESESDMPKELLEMDAPDILITPIGGSGVLSAADAQKLAVKLEAKIVIPIFFDAKTLKTFLKEAGSEGVKPVDKLTLKSKDVAGKENEVVVLSA